MHRVLIIGRTTPCPGLQRGLLEEGMLTALVSDFWGGLRQARVRGYDVVVVIGSADLAEVKDLVVALRRETSSAVVALLAGEHADPVARVEILTAGADDCLSVHADPQELVARVLAKHRRWRVSTGGAATIRDVLTGVPDRRYEHPVRNLRFAGGVLNLTRTEALILQALMRNPGKPMRRHDLALHAFGESRKATARGIDVQICRLRKKLRQLDGGPVEIRTVPRVGYLLIDRRPPTSGADRAA